MSINVTVIKADKYIDESRILQLLISILARPPKKDILCLSVTPPPNFTARYLIGRVCTEPRILTAKESRNVVFNLTKSIIWAIVIRK